MTRETVVLGTYIVGLIGAGMAIIMRHLRMKRRSDCRVGIVCENIEKLCLQDLMDQLPFAERAQREYDTLKRLVMSKVEGEEHVTPWSFPEEQASVEPRGTTEAL